MVTAKNKRWNGNLDSLPIDYLKDVVAKMQDYGDQVQFSLVSGGPQPCYQITNSHGKQMAFDRNHHLMRPEGHEFIGANASQVLTVEQVKARISGAAIGSGAPSRAPRVVRAGSAGTRTSAARLDEQFAAQRYEYFRNHRQSLPPSITEHSDEITSLMRSGKSAEEAFTEVVKKYF